MSFATDRRQVLGALFAAPTLGALLPAAARASSRGAAPQNADRPVDPGDVAAAARLIGLQFDAAELERLAPELERQRGVLDVLRGLDLPNGAAPAHVFRASTAAAHAETRKPGIDALLASEARPESDDDLAFLPVHRLAPLLRDRKLRSIDLTRLCLDRLERIGRDRLLAVVELTRERALAAAAAADAELDAGRWRGPLHGVPYGLKDLFAVRGTRTTYGAAPFRDQRLDEDATVFTRLEAAGAILCGKLTLGALAMGDRWFGGRTRNPWRLEQGSSGSSAGSASTVAAGLLPFAIGTETLGSIVSPCTRCGATGLRPSFGAVPRGGAMALVWSMDKIGPITRSVRDAALVHEAMRGPDPSDLSSVPTAALTADFAAGLKGRRIGVAKGTFDGRRAARDRRVLDELRALGAELVEVALPAVDPGPLRAILNVEAAAAFESITRDGRDARLVAQGRRDWAAIFRRARFMPAVEVLLAERERARLVTAWDAIWNDLDVIVCPSFAGGALTATNFTGHPTVVVPNGFVRAAPRSITFLGRIHGEGPLLEVAAAYQERTGFHLRRPSI